MASFLEKVLVYFGFKETGKDKIVLTDSDLKEIGQKIKTANIPRAISVDYANDTFGRTPTVQADNEIRFSKKTSSHGSDLVLKKIIKNAVDFSSILSKIEILPEYHEALSHLQSQDNHEITFVTGGAGTGKSVFVKWLSCQLPKDRFVILCPTGAAAINVGGSTVHSFCRFRPAVTEFKELLRDDDYRNNNFLHKVANQIDYIIFDEISMVRCDLFDAVDEFFRHFSRVGNKPFGGKKLLVVGDLLQLPPVVKNEDKPDLERFGYSHPFFCFNSKAWSDSKLKLVPLTRNLRQNSALYYKHLNRVRLGREVSETISYFNTNCRDPEFRRFPVLTTVRASAARINEEELNLLPGAGDFFLGRIVDEFPFDEKELPAPSKLELKVGARIMLVKNDPDGSFVNGSTGIVTEIVPSIMEIDGYVKILLDGKQKREVAVTKAIWEKYKYLYSEEKNCYTQEVVGRYIQMPIIPAWAITIHKAQGMTIPSLSVDVGSGTFAAGQMYVALSRCPDVTGLLLEQELKDAHVFHSREAEAEYRRLAEINK